MQATATVIELSIEEDKKSNDLLEKYQKLNEQCDRVLEKIKNRKSKKVG